MHHLSRNMLGAVRRWVEQSREHRRHVRIRRALSDLPPAIQRDIDRDPVCRYRR